MLVTLNNLELVFFPITLHLVSTVIPEINVWLNKCEWDKFRVFELNAIFNKWNGVIDCELKTATKIITSKLSEQFDHKCTCYTQKLFLQVYLQYY